MNNFSQNVIKESPEQIEKEIYEIIKNIKVKHSFEKKDISKVSNDYFLFQQKILDLFERKINISIKRETINFNNILQVNTNTPDVPSVFLRYTTLENDSGIHWTTGYFKEMSSILPVGPINIHINFGIARLNTDTEEPIQEYFFEHLKQLNTLYYKDIEKLKSFLIPLHEVIHFLTVKENSKPLFLEDQYYSPSSIIKKLNSNKEINEMIYLSYDFDINEKLSLMKKAIKNNKNSKVFLKD